MARKTITRTGPPAFPEHPVEEHRWRLERTRRIMSQEGLDALIFSRNVTVFWITGSRFVFVGMDAPVALAPQSTAIVTPSADIYCQRFGPFDSDEVSLHTTTSGSLESYDDETELVSILRDYDVKRGDRVGVEWGPALVTGINPIKFTAIKERMERELGVEVVDATVAINKVMSVKSPLEQGRLREAAQIAARAMQRVYDIIEIGMTEVELSRTAKRLMLDEGADALSHAQVMAEGDGKMSFLSSDALDRAIERGWVHLDMGCKVRRYMSDINRGVFLGRKPTAAERKLFECRRGVNELFDRIIRPGVPIDDVLDQMVSYVESQGCEVPKLGGIVFGGHSLGLEPYQKPNLIPSSAQPEYANRDGHVVFEPGMVFTYETPVALPGAPKMPFFNVEDNVLVTETGVENLTAGLSRDLQVKM